MMVSLGPGKPAAADASRSSSVIRQVEKSCNQKLSDIES
jgi:hypothetical protein